jgi:hypothetical protein
VLPRKGHLDEVDIVFSPYFFEVRKILRSSLKKGLIKVYWTRGKSNSNRAVVTRP